MFTINHGAPTYRIVEGANDREVSSLQRGEAAGRVGGGGKIRHGGDDTRGRRRRRLSEVAIKQIGR